MKRTLAVILLLSLMLSALSSCGETEALAQEETIPAAADTEEVPEEPETTYLEALPVMDMGGITINTLIREEMADEFFVEDTGDIIDEAVFNRNMRIEERYSCKLDWTIELGSYTYVSQYQDLIRSTVMAGDSTYDLVTGQSNIVQPLNKENVFVNLLDESNIDLTKPYWVDAYTDGVNLTGEVFTVCGDFALSSFSNANVMFFNKGLMDEYSMEYPYEDALAGKWTLDKLLNTAEAVTSDLNGDGVIDINDRKGLCGWGNTMQPFFSASGLNYTEKDADGKRVLLTPTERMISVAEKMTSFCLTDSFFEGTKNLDTSNLEYSASQHFMEGKIMFMGMVLSGIEFLRDMEVDFGILPYPKYDEAQENYYTTILRRYSVAAIPTTASNSANSAMILEALAADGAQSIIPKYYEIALKNKYVRDDASSQVLDLIKDSLYLEFTDMYYNDLGFSDFFAYHVIAEPEGTFVSKYTANMKAWSAKIEKLYEAD